MENGSGKERGAEGNNQRKMNNFFLYMPGGYYRQYSSLEDKVRIMKAIDELLAGEFASLDVCAIMQTMKTIYALITEVMADGDYLKQKESLGEKIDMVNRELEKLRPLFDQLVLMGFDPVLLAR